MSDETTFHIGDSDLAFLGLCAALAARYHMRRKGGSMFALDDAHAIELLQSGISAGAGIPLDDVPDLHIGVSGESETLAKLRDMMRDLEAEAAEDDDDDASDLPGLFDPDDDC